MGGINSHFASPHKLGDCDELHREDWAAYMIASGEDNIQNFTQIREFWS